MTGDRTAWYITVWQPVPVQVRKGPEERSREIERDQERAREEGAWNSVVRSALAMSSLSNEF